MAGRGGPAGPAVLLDHQRGAAEPDGLPRRLGSVLRDRQRRAESRPRRSIRRQATLMTSTTPGHPLVRAYLGELATALAALPPNRANELMDQITTHLEDTLPPGAEEQEVAEVLRRLGQPADLAAEAAGRGGPRRRRKLGPPWLPWSVSALIAVVVLGAGYLIAIESAPALQPAGASIWWYPLDVRRGVWISEPTGESVISTPIRSGQMQGFVVTIRNPSDWTQTVLGPAAGFVTPGGPVGIQIAVAGYNRNIDEGGMTINGLSFASPGSIPPHQIRALRVLWRTTICQEQGASMLVNRLDLRVRVGGITRTEVVTLDDYWTLSGASAPGVCS